MLWYKNNKERKKQIAKSSLLSSLSSTHMCTHNAVKDLILLLSGKTHLSQSSPSSPTLRLDLQVSALKSAVPVENCCKLSSDFISAQQLKIWPMPFFFPIPHRTPLDLVSSSPAHLHTMHTLCIYRKRKSVP